MHTRTLRHLAVLVACALAAEARANPFDVFGYSARGIAMGGALTTLADDFTAAYYNPAGLAWREKVHFGIGFQAAVPALSIERTKTDSAIPNAMPPTHSGITIGAVFPLGARIQNRIAFGIGVYVPTSALFRLDSVDQTTPQFYSYHSLPAKLVIAPALGFRLHEKLRIGVGLLVLADLVGAGDFHIDIVNRRLVRRNLQVDLDPSASGTAGLVLGPFAGFRFGFSFRGALGLNFRLPANLTLDGVGQLALDIKGVAAWTPNQYTMGASYELPSQRLRIGFDLTVAQWSQAPDPAIKLDVTARGEVFERLGLTSALTFVSPDLPLGAVTTWSPRLGAEWGFHKDWLLRGGYFFRPSPLPKQDGFTNHLDNDVHALSAGIAWTAPDYLEIHRNPVTLELAFQSLLLPNRAVVKRLAHDPVGNLQSRGAVFTIAVSMRHDF